MYAPSEDAFTNLPPSIVKKLQNDDNWSFVHDVTAYHITRGNLSFLNWTTNMIVPTLLDGKSIRLNIYKNKTGEVNNKVYMLTRKVLICMLSLYGGSRNFRTGGLVRAR